MLDIENKKYSNRKPIEYGDDVAVLFYKGKRICKNEIDSYKKSWSEESDYFDNMNDFLEDVVGDVNVEIETEDAQNTWDDIWLKLTWDRISRSYKYSNWELIVLNI